LRLLCLFGDDSHVTGFKYLTMKNNPHVPLFTQSPLAQLAISFCAGILSLNLWRGGLPILLVLGALCSIAALLALFRRHHAIAGISLVCAMFFSGGSLAWLGQRRGAKDGLKQLMSRNTIPARTSLELTGVLDGPPEFARDRIYLLLRVESLSLEGTELKTSGVVALLAPFQTSTSEKEYRGLDLRYGARMRVKTVLNRTDNYRNPGVSTLTEYLDREGYDATGLVKGPRSIIRLDDAAVFRPLAWLYGWRERLQRQIDSHFSPETAGVLDAALLGNRYNLSRGVAERFREGGTFHVLVISGLHISFIGGIVFLFVRRLSRNRLLQFVFSSTVVWGYSLAVGAEASVVRAALMFTFVAFAAVVFRSASSLNALGGAALILLTLRPKAIFDPSLQLTFLSVLAIVVIAWPLIQTCSAIGAWRPTRERPYPPACSRTLKALCEVLFWSERNWQREVVRQPHHYRLFKIPIAAWMEQRYLQNGLRYIFGAVVVSVSVQAVLLPMLIIYFHRLSVVSLLLNIGVSILLAVLALVALTALLFAQISVTLAEPLFKLAHALDWLMVHSVDPFARLGLASLRLPEYSGWASLIYVVYYFPLVFLLVEISRWRPLGRPVMTGKRDKRVRLALVAQFAMLAVVVWHPLSSGRPDGKLHIDFLDVGQGDAALVTMPDGTTLLVDGGGRPSFAIPATEFPAAPGGVGLGDAATTGSFERETRSIGETVVAEYLWWRGLDRVDYVLATHADADHIDGLNDVLANFDVRSAFVGRTPQNDGEYSKFYRTLVSTGTHVEALQSGDVIRFGRVVVRVMWPPAAAELNAPSRNNDSVVLILEFGKRSVLLTGDIEKGAENALVGRQENLRADVVKVPHHGSKTSSTEPFVMATRPRFAVISVGQTSMFGHPHREVVERWQASGAEVLTTGACGTINVITDGEELTVTKFINP
jgi:competence protein ComEC